MDILIVDDDPTSVFLVKLLLTRSGLFDRIISFNNPVDALSFIQEEIDGGHLPKVILLDINMPQMDGWRLLEELTPYQSQLRPGNAIYMLTSSIDIFDITHAKEHPLVTDIIFRPLAVGKIREIYEQVR